MNRILSVASGSVSLAGNAVIRSGWSMLKHGRASSMIFDGAAQIRVADGFDTRHYRQCAVKRLVPSVGGSPTR
jgi:hypothetical protein